MESLKTTLNVTLWCCVRTFVQDIKNLPAHFSIELPESVNPNLIQVILSKNLKFHFIFNGHLFWALCSGLVLEAAKRVSGLVLNAPTGCIWHCREQFDASAGCARVRHPDPGSVSWAGLPASGIVPPEWLWLELACKTTGITVTPQSDVHFPHTHTWAHVPDTPLFTRYLTHSEYNLINMCAYIFWECTFALTYLWICLIWLWRGHAGL